VHVHDDKPQIAKLPNAANPINEHHRGSGK
jgi:hypothetical protein